MKEQIEVNAFGSSTVYFKQQITQILGPLVLLQELE